MSSIQKKPLPVRHRNIAITKNNYTDQDILDLKLFAEEYCSYAVYGKEISGLNHTPHLQCYFEFAGNTQMTNRTICKKLFSCHIEERKERSTPQCAAGYCKKGTEAPPEDRNHDYFYHNPSTTWNGWEFGTLSKQGKYKGKQLADITQEIADGTTTLDDITMSDPMIYHMYGRTLSKVEDICLRKKFRTWMTECVWYAGPTGVGKSHRAYKGFDPSTHYVMKLTRAFKDAYQCGYTGQETVIINDLRAKIQYEEFLNLVDKWPFYLDRKGREPVPFLAKRVIVTSRYTPHQLYPVHVVGDYTEIDRRVKLVEISQADFDNLEEI